MNTCVNIHSSYARMEECCLCRRSVGIGGSRKKRKLLYGTGMCGVNSILERLAEIKGQHAFLYHVCEGRLQSVAKHEEQLRTLRAQKMY